MKEFQKSYYRKNMDSIRERGKEVQKKKNTFLLEQEFLLKARLPLPCLPEKAQFKLRRKTSKHITKKSLMGRGMMQTKIQRRH